MMSPVAESLRDSTLREASPSSRWDQPLESRRLIQNGEIETEKSNFISNEEADGKYKHFLLEEMDMIVPTSGTLGKMAIIRK